MQIRKMASGAVLAVLALAGLARAQEAGVQLTPDSARYLISKDVGTERWAISVNAEDRTATGNVFMADGSPTAFVWCDITDIAPDPDPARSVYTLSCWGADACTAAPCTESEWRFIRDGIELTGSFLLPPGTASTLSGNVQGILTNKCAFSPACHAVGGAGNVDLAEGATWKATFEVESQQREGAYFVVPFSPGSSYLLDKIKGDLGPDEGSRMPLGAPPLSDEETATIRRWIREGAVDN